MSGNMKLADAMREGRSLSLTVIDMHAHVGRYSAFYAPHPDAAGMVEVMDAVGVAVTAISSHGGWAADAAEGNAETARATAEYPTRLLGYAVASPHYPGLILDELTRCFDEYGFKMIKIHPGAHTYPLTGPNYEEVYRFAAEHRAPVLTHTWEREPYSSPDLAAEVARRHGDVVFLWGHSGALSFDRAIELAADLPNVYLDLACSQVFKGQVEYFLSRISVDRILFGSDFSFISQPQQIAKVVFADIAEADKEKILYGNAARLLESIGITVGRSGASARRL
jgi:predicted TIM-barrel fold metal-dependent hydrolase